MGRHSAGARPAPPPDDQDTQRLPAAAILPNPRATGRAPFTFGAVRHRRPNDNVRDGLIYLALLAAGLLAVWFVVLGMTP